jgi:DNA-binding transcriptional ArsR family regulator
MDILKVLGNEKRRAMLKILARRPAHISGLARELGISVPVALKHVRLLESSQFIDRETAGNTVILSIREETIELLHRLEDIIEKPLEIGASKGEELYKVLKRVGGFEIRKVPGSSEFFITAIDGVKGYYIFQIDGKIPDVGVKEYILKEDTIIEFQKLVPVIGKRLEIQVD